MLVFWVEEGLKSVLKVSRCVEPLPSALHVGSAAKVRFSDGKVYPAKVLGIGTKIDMEHLDGGVENVS
jgi:hypothetical protein